MQPLVKRREKTMHCFRPGVIKASAGRMHRARLYSARENVYAGLYT